MAFELNLRARELVRELVCDLLASC